MPTAADPPSITDYVYLTFDDGPDPQWTPRVLDLLAHQQCHATFFVIGLEALKQPSLIRRMEAEGHTVGNHTFSHRHPWLLSRTEACKEVQIGARAIEDILGHPPRLYRPPHGRHRSCMLEEAQRNGEAAVLWDVSAVDWGPLGDAPRIAGRLRRTQSGNVVLMHDGRNRHNRPDQLVQVLPEFLTELRQRTLQAVALA